MPSPKETGDKSEGMVLAALLRAGRVVLQPFGDNQRYDLVTESAGNFTRIQCKTGHVADGAVVFKTCSNHYHRGGTTLDYRGQADFFGVYVPEIDKVYLVPVNEVPRTEGRLRLTHSKYAPQKRSKVASDYELMPV